MNRDQFITEMRKTLSIDSIMSNDEISKALDNSIDIMDKKALATFRGSHNVLIIIEEMNELIFELSNAEIFSPNITGLTEEIADVALGLELLSKIYDIKIDEIPTDMTSHIKDKTQLHCALIATLSKLVQELTKTLRHREPNKDTLKCLTENCLIYLSDMYRVYNFTEGAIDKDTFNAARTVKVRRFIEASKNADYN